MGSAVTALLHGIKGTTTICTVLLYYCAQTLFYVLTDINRYLCFEVDRPCHGVCIQLLASYHRGPGSCPSQSMGDLWLTEWHWDRFFSNFFSCLLSVSLHHGSPYSYIIWGMNYRHVGGRSSET
jgi:hypothetical protein